MSAGGRVREVHFGRVLDNNDPAKAGGLKVRVDTLLEGAELLSGYIPASFPFAGNGQGFFFVPDPGAQVEVEVTADPDRAIESIEARWRSGLYSSVDAIPAEFLSNPTQRGGIKYGTNVLLFDKAAELIGFIAKVVKLGSEGASEPFVCGAVYEAFIKRFMTNYGTHTHVGLGFGPSPQATAFQAAEDPITGQQLSDKIFGEKS